MELERVPDLFPTQNSSKFISDPKLDNSVKVPGAVGSPIRSDSPGRVGPHSGHLTGEIAVPPRPGFAHRWPQGRHPSHKQRKWERRQRAEAARKS